MMVEKKDIKEQVLINKYLFNIGQTIAAKLKYLDMWFNFFNVASAV